MKFRWGDKVIYDTDKIKFVSNKKVKNNKVIKRHNFWLGKFSPLPKCCVCDKFIFHIPIFSERHGHCKICGGVFDIFCGEEIEGDDFCDNCKKFIIKMKINKIKRYY